MGHSHSRRESPGYYLYIALSEGPPGERPHVGLIVGRQGDKTAKGYLYHAKITTQANQRVWIAETKELKTEPSRTFLVRVVVGEVRDHKRLAQILRSTPPPEYPDRCRHWAGDAYGAACVDSKALREHAGGWNNIYEVAFRHAATQRGNQHEPATYDMLEHRWISS
ncbi:hypothetical protein ANO11243_084360 [Dothideomycetidae sp. 11243]|nr:hypothetical protein ANO11243_084360 [fungal sp. No.11243]